MFQIHSSDSIYPIECTYIKNEDILCLRKILRAVKVRAIWWGKEPYSFHSAVSEKSKMSQPIRGQRGHLVFPISPKNTNLVEDVEILLPVNFHWVLFSGFRGEVKNVSEPRAAILFFRSTPLNTNLVEDVEILLPVKFPWIPFSSFREEVEND